ncbi:MAG: hypothetical protein AAB666_03420 [Patescibacteria group bacterium]
MSEIQTPNPPEIEQVMVADPVRDKKGVAIWKKIQKTNGEITDEINENFKNKFGGTFSDWASRKGLLSIIGTATDLAQDNLEKIIQELEQNQ